MAAKLSFPQRHPIISGFLILGFLLIFFLGGLNYLLRSCTSDLARKGHLISGKDEVIGVVEVKGMITSPDRIIKNLAALRGNKSVKGIVVRIESPGGAVGASQEVFREIGRSSREKPVVASMGSVAASGGYYVALGARKIVASPGTLTGSIGVILKFPNLQELYKKIGYESQVVKSGEFKDIGSTDKELTQEERDLLNNLLDNVYQQFVTDVSRERDLPVEKVRELADGRIFSGEQALESGLIDENGNFYDAVRLCAEMADMAEKSPELYYPGEKKMDLFKILSRENLDGLLGLLRKGSPVIASELTIERQTR
ncbi:MAG: signal peptide peptidase SppA [Desulfurivibrionaceae bacterium]